MNKEEFLQALRHDLAEDVPPAVVEENVRYYREYIEGETANGRSEEEVVDELGAPHLIARNIEDTLDIPEGEPRRQGYSDPGGETYTESGDTAGEPGSGRTFHLFDLSKWYGWVALILVIVVIIYVVFAVVNGVFTFLAPVLVPILLIWLVIRLIRLLFGSGRR